MVKPSLPHHGPSIDGTMGTDRSTLPIHGVASIGICGRMTTDGFAEAAIFSGLAATSRHTVSIPDLFDRIEQFAANLVQSLRRCHFGTVQFADVEHVDSLIEVGIDFGEVEHHLEAG